MARLRQLQQQIAQIVARNAQEVHQMMQSAYRNSFSLPLCRKRIIL
jgi:hypothetical protein